jgi:hypothetical protein
LAGAFSGRTRDRSSSDSAVEPPRRRTTAHAFLANRTNHPPAQIHRQRSHPAPPPIRAHLKNHFSNALGTPADSTRPEIALAFVQLASIRLWLRVNESTSKWIKSDTWNPLPVTTRGEHIIAIETVPERIAMARMAGATSLTSPKRTSLSGSRRSAEAKVRTWCSTASAWKRVRSWAGRSRQRREGESYPGPSASTFSTKPSRAIKAMRPCGVVSVRGVYGGRFRSTWARSCFAADKPT